MFQPLYVRSLSEHEEETLLKYSKSASKEESVRARIVLESSRGRSAGEISELVGFHTSNVKKWIRKFNTDGLQGLIPRKRGPQGGPRPTFSEDQVLRIRRLAVTPPSEFGYGFTEWTPQKLANAASERGIVEKISHVTVRQILRKAGIGTADPVRENRSGPMRSATRVSETDQSIGFRALAQEALYRFDFREAAAHLTLALEESLGPEEEADVRIQLAQALEELGSHEDARNAIRKYDAPASVAGLSSRTRARIKLRQASSQVSRGDYAVAIALINEARRIFLEIKDEMGLSASHYALGKAYIEINEFRIARDHLLEAANCQKSVSDRELLANIYVRLGNVDFFEGAFSSAREMYLRALEVSRSSANKSLIGMIYLNLGTAQIEGQLGKSEESAGYLRRAIEFLEESGQRAHLPRAYNNLGDNYRLTGRWDEAIQYLERSIKVAEDLANAENEAIGRITLAQILCARGCFSDAEEHLHRSMQLNCSDRSISGDALRVLAQVQTATGRLEDALKTLRQSLQTSTAIGYLNGVSLTQVELAETHFAAGAHDRAREYLELAQARLREEESLLIAGLVQRLGGQIEAQLGRYDVSQQHIAQSISVFKTIAIPFELARSQYQMGVLLRKAGDSEGAELNLQAAREIFESVGAKPDLERTLTALDSSASRGSTGGRVSAPTDVLLMERLIEASASRELLAQELAAIINENFGSRGVGIACRSESGDEQVLAVQGTTRENLLRELNAVTMDPLEPVQRIGGHLFVSMGLSTRSPLSLFVNSGASVELNRLQPLIKQAELGFEACLLRSAARRSPAPEQEHRMVTVMPGFILASTVMSEVIGRIQKIRTSDVTVLITGESGTGKELVARLVHAESARARAIFLPFNCTATPKEIIDSQLFGHRRGAFTGATANYPGIIRAADGGTLFLDEIGDLSLEVQPKLMRFLQESEIQPLGETKPIRVDVRVIAATNSDLETAVAEGRFREDLFHRLNIIRIHVPPLRERREEIPVLVNHFLDHFASRSGKGGIRLSEDAIDALKGYNWPGNVRQLRNEIERVVTYGSAGIQIEAEELSPEVLRSRELAPSFKPPQYASVREPYMRPEARNGSGPERNDRNGNGGQLMKLKDATAALERQLITEAMFRNRNNLSRTANELGLSRRGLRLKLSQLNIERFGQIV